MGKPYCHRQFGFNLVWDILKMKMLEVFNDNNNLLIDDEMFNLVLKRKLSRGDLKRVGDKTDPLYNAKPYYSFNMQSGEQFIAISSLAGEYISYTTWGGVKDKYIDFYDKKGNSIQVPDSVVVYTFGEPEKEPSRHLTGFECYNEKGEVVFSSKYKYLRCLDFCDINSTYDKEIIGKTLALVNFNIYQENTVTYNAGDKTLEDETFTHIGYLQGNKYGTDIQHAWNVDTDVPDENGHGYFQRTQHLGDLRYMIIDVTGY